MIRQTLAVLISAAALAAPVAVSPVPVLADDMPMQHAMGATTTQFAGLKANKGTATAVRTDGKLMLTLSDDFVIPDTPAPHWQVVDSSGNVYLLNRLKIKGDKFNKTITVPSYVKDVAKVQIWCSFAEVLLGEASFAQPQ